MEVLLSSGLNVELSIAAMRLYLQRKGIERYLYAWPKFHPLYTSEKCVRIDEGEEPEYSIPYIVCNKDLGKEVWFEEADIRDGAINQSSIDFRIDPVVIGIVKELGKKADANDCLSIADVPEYVEWRIECDSDWLTEWVEEGYEPPRRWYGKGIEHYGR